MSASGDLYAREDDRSRSGNDRDLLRRLLPWIRPYKGRVALAVLLLVLVSGLGIAGPYLVKLAIDRAMEGDAAQAERMAALLRITGLYAGVLVVTALLHYGQIMVLQTTGQRIMYDLRTHLFRHVLRQDLKLFDRQPVGRLMTRLTSDIDALNELFTSGIVTVAMDVFTLAAIMSVMVWMDWQLALLSFAVIPPLFALSLLFRGRVRDAFRRIRVRVARINSYLQEHLAGIRVVQAFGQEEARLQRFESLNEEHTEAQLDTVRAFAIFFPAVEILSTAAVTLLLWVGTDLVARDAVTLGTLVAFVQYAQRFYRPISDLSEKVNILQGAMAASERIFDLLDTHPTIEAPERGASDNGRARGHIRFEGVHFHYDPLREVVGDDRPVPVLRGLDFEVQPGERVAIVGSTGAGKSTVISLLLRFYDVREGSITLDGHDVRELAPRELRAQVGMVLQDPRLFSGTLRDNLALLRDDIPDNVLLEAAERVGLARVIERLPGGLDEELHEGGGRLSTGERQLVSFARALVHDPPILILDEATASVDAGTEARLVEATREVLAGRTSLVIAHRLSTVRDADRILVLHKGKLAEQGTHDELMAEGGIYRRLVELQMAGRTAA